MTIKIVFIEDAVDRMGLQGLFCPLFVCDICGESIKNARHAAAVFNMLSKSARIDVQHVHKGKCLDISERQIGKGFGWSELLEHIQYLKDNATPK